MPYLAERGELLELGHCRNVAGEGVVSLAEVRETVAEPAAGVGDKVPERRALGDVVVAEVEFGQVAPDRRVEIQRTPLDEAHHDGCRHRLGDRRDLEEGVGVYREGVLEVRDPVRGDVLVAVMENADRDPGDVIPGHPLTHQLLELRPHARIVRALSSRSPR